MMRVATIQELREKLDGISVARAGSDGVLKTGWPAVDEAIGGGLLEGGLHEWIGVASPNQDRSVSGGDQRRQSRTWSPPLCVLVHLAWQSLLASSHLRWTVWVGQRCFPYPSVMVKDRGTDRRLLDRSLFIMPRNAEGRLWAADIALRSPAVGAVVVDGNTFSMAATRRMQLLAKEHRTLALAVRPTWEQGELSAAHSRWHISWRAFLNTTQQAAHRPQWSLRLLRYKGQPPQRGFDQWVLEWDSGAGALNLFTEVAHSTRATKNTQRHAQREPRGHFRSQPTSQTA